ncbi:MAG TPA: thioredoxin domain-containing protein, partial [Chloroflexota bacterium]|nr:thioredoxin domain-containing protein [Chloroflexota bacterium]
LYDNATPAGSSVAVDVLQRLAAYTGEGAYGERAERYLSALAASVAQHPAAFGRLLSALDFAIGPVQEVALVGDPAGPDTRDLLAALYARYDPNRVLALRPPGVEGESLAAVIPLLEGRTASEGRATAYVCQHFACRLPVTTPEDLLRQLDTQVDSQLGG